jgi:hypothetical protein
MLWRDGAAHWLNEPGPRCLHLKVWALRRKARSLHIERRTLSMHRQASHTQDSEERPGLREARSGVAS